ncbi:MAG: DUF4040 domain-containing protein [Candidatus Aureabacteria bacterium]|nr:DUF4040 domain-containing protein [Candidatus Auribacterota bacterium]
MDLICVLVSVMIFGAIAALQSRNLRTAALGLGGTGIVCAVTLFVMRAPAPALAQLVATLLLTAVLMRVTAGRESSVGTGDRGWGMAFGAAVLVILAFIIIRVPLRELARSGAGVRAMVGGAHGGWLGEFAVLVAAAAGVFALLRKNGTRPPGGGE